MCTKLTSCQNSNEADTAKNVKSKHTEKETMGSDDRSSDGDTLLEGQGQVKNVVKKRRKCNNAEPTTDDVFYNVNILSIMVFSLF